jgi:hypothetical protein
MAGDFIEGHESYAKGKTSCHKRFNGEDYFWCGKHKTKWDVKRYASSAKARGYRYRIERIREVSRFTYEKVTRYNLWLKKVR